jgi:hypothetical protein
LGKIGTATLETRIQELVAIIPNTAVLLEPLPVVRRAPCEQIVILHRRLLAIVRDNEVRRRARLTIQWRQHDGFATALRGHDRHLAFGATHLQSHLI